MPDSGAKAPPLYDKLGSPEEISAKSTKELVRFSMSSGKTFKMRPIGGSKKSGRLRGQALVELAIIAPWIFFLFISVVDTGFCLVAAIGVQNAARAAALYTSSSSVTATATAACSVVRNELQALPGYSSSSNTNCSSPSLHVTASQTTTQTVVTVTYQTLSLTPVPGLFSGPYTITRSATFPTRSN